MSHASFQHWVDFCTGKARDTNGRLIAEIWRYSFDQLDAYHDYVQWLFPTTKASPVNISSPIWDEEQWRELPQATKRQVISSVNRSVLTMLKFWGISYADKHFTLMHQAPHRYKQWLSNSNHNQLRISRMLTTLVLVGEVNVAKDLNRFLRTMVERHGVYTDSTGYWQRAVNH